MTGRTLDGLTFSSDDDHSLGRVPDSTFGDDDREGLDNAWADLGDLDEL